MAFTEAEITRFLLQYLLPLFRIAALFMVVPVISSRIVPARVRLVLALVVTLLVVPLLPAVPATQALSFKLILTVVQEIAIGVTIGFVFQIAFQVFVLSGQFMAMKMGLGFASMNDPTNGVQTTVLSQFFLMLVTLIFVTIDGHLILIQMLVQSFNTLPPGGSQLDADIYFQIASLGSWMFLSALVFALPVLTSLLFVNIAFGVMSRAAPQLNIFAVGFPFTLISGLFLVYLGLNNFETSFHNVMAYAFSFANEVLEIK